MLLENVGKVMPSTYLSTVTHSSDGTNGSQDSFGELEDNQEHMLDILLSTITNVDGTWKKTWVWILLNISICQRDLFCWSQLRSQ
jgi:hypothetical protein